MEGEANSGSNDARIAGSIAGASGAGSGPVSGSPVNGEGAVVVEEAKPASASTPVSDRVFLVLVDDSEEMPVALRFACQRAKQTNGRVALLYVQEPAEFMHWMGVESRMREESRAEGEALVQKLAADVLRSTGQHAILYLREGERAQSVFDLLQEDDAISILVIAASTSAQGPGPVVSYLTGKGLPSLKTPITIVPGGLSDAEIDAIT